MTSTTLAQSADAVPGRSELQAILDDFVASGITGLTIRMHNEYGDWTGCAGVSQIGHDATPPIDGHVRIGSNTKTFTATLVLQLVAEGKIGLDTPAADYLPEFGLDPRITVRMLLQHTSGMFNFTGEFYADGTVVAGHSATTGKEWVDNRFTTYQPEELVRLALSKPARFEPGTDWSYSNTNYVLARLLIEKVTGRSFAEEMQRLILGPLGLTGTVVPTTETGDPRAARPRLLPIRRRRQRKTVDVTRQNPSWISSGGDMISTTGTCTRSSPRWWAASCCRPRCWPRCATPSTPIPRMSYGLGVFVQDSATTAPSSPTTAAPRATRR